MPATADRAQAHNRRASQQTIDKGALADDLLGEKLGSVGARGQLHDQHQRLAHFRLLPTGRVTFVRQVTVRPDVPMLEKTNGYRVQA